MAAAVAPSSNFKPVKNFNVDGKPGNVTIYGTSCTGYPQEYLDRKAAVGEDFLTLKCGRKLCYFKDGDPSGVPMICLHGGGEGKFSWLQKEPLPGVYMIAVDRMGYGGSDLVEDVQQYEFADAVDDIKQLAEGLGFSKWIQCGFSIGTSWALQIATQLHASLLGVILFGTMGDTGHPDCTTASAIGKPPSILNPFTGCCGCILKGAFMDGAPKNQKLEDGLKYCFNDDSSHEKVKNASWADFSQDDFWISTKIDSFQAFNRGEALMGDAYRSLFSPWQYDIKTIPATLPVYIFQGEGDIDMGSSYPAAPEFVKQCVPHAVFETIPGTGHMTTTGPIERMRKHFATAVAAMQK